MTKRKVVEYEEPEKREPRVLIERIGRIRYRLTFIDPAVSEYCREYADTFTLSGAKRLAARRLTKWHRINSYKSIKLTVE